jgi:hypothetical protein
MIWFLSEILSFVKARQSVGVVLPRQLEAEATLTQAPGSQFGSRSFGPFYKSLKLLVGAGRFELPTPCSRSKCSAGYLRHSAVRSSDGLGTVATGARTNLLIQIRFIR